MASGERKTVPRGTVIAERYRVDHRLATGGMATVYVATDTTLSRKVALKVLHTQKGEDPGRLRERFRLEAEALARLNHRHIVAIYDYGDTEDGGHYLVMELVEGPSLFAVMKRERLEVMRSMRIAYQTARALRFAHKADIIHRDVKTGNILLANEDDEEIAKLVDFGLVKLTSGGQQLTAHGLILGTVHCMAPEQIRGGEIDARTDIYALGVVLFRMVTGKYPFNSKQTAEVLAAHLHAAVPSFQSVDPNVLVPPELEGVIRRCMQKNQDNRYQTCSELIRELEQCMRVPKSEWVRPGEPAAVAAASAAPPAPNSSGLLMLFILGLFTLVMLLIIIIVALLARSPSAMTSGATSTVDVATFDAAAPLPVAPPEPTPDQAPPPVDIPSDDETDPGIDGPDEMNADAPEVPVAPSPSPRPRADRSRPTAAPSPPEPEPELEPEPEPEPPEGRRVEDVEAKVAADRVEVEIHLAGGDVRPLHFASEAADGPFSKQYQVVFRNTSDGLDSEERDISVAHELVESITSKMINGSLVVQVNSLASPRMRLEGSGGTYSVIVTP